MKMNTLEEQIKLLKAEVNDEIIEEKSPLNNFYNLKSTTKGIWDFNSINYRIKPKIKWKPENGNWHINMHGTVSDGTTLNATCIEFGSKFQLKEQAEKASKAYKCYHRLYRFAEEINSGWIPEFKSLNQSNYYIVIDDNKLIVDCETNYHIPTVVYFRTKELAQHAINVLGDELLCNL